MNRPLKVLATEKIAELDFWCHSRVYCCVHTSDMFLSLKEMSSEQQHFVQGNLGLVGLHNIAINHQFMSHQSKDQCSLFEDYFVDLKVRLALLITSTAQQSLKCGATILLILLT